MKYTTAVCLTFSSMLLCACTQSSVDVEAERTALRAAADAYHEAGEGLDADGFASSYTSNGLILPPNEAAVTGRDGAYEFIASFAEAPGASVSFSNMNVDVAASGDIGYTLADAVVTVDGPDGQPIKNKIRDFHLWKKQDGQWKIAIDIWNSELPLPGVAAQTQAKIEATIFAYDGQDFIRTQTTLATEDGKSAVDTKLDHDTSAYEALIEKRSYAGDATLFGRNYEANYAPLTGKDGRLTGALFVAVTK